MIQNNPKYNLNTITNFIIKCSNIRKFDINNLKLQKILYFVQSQFLVNYQQVCFTKPIYALSFGPVVKSIYNYFKFYGTTDINTLIPNTTKQTITKRDQELIINILRQCAQYNDTELLHLIYQQTPYKIAQNNTTKVIDINDLYKFFI